MTATSDVAVAVDTAVYPGLTPRLITVAAPEGAEAYIAQGGYAPLRDPDGLLAQVALAGLRGRGGAAFPLARKIEAVRASGVAPVVLANGEEGEPASIKDRWLMRTRPHLVLDGARLAAAMTGAQDIVLYVSDPAAAASLRQAAAEFPAEGWNEVSISVHQVEPSYVAGEETAAVRSVNGGPALPQEKPPRPFESGAYGRPTLVSNVETLANLPIILRDGAQAYREAGTEDSAGSFLLTLSGDGRGGLFEVPFGVTLADVLSWRGVDAGSVNAVLVGGYFGGLLGAPALTTPLEYAEFSALGSGLGCGAFALVKEADCVIDVAAGVMAYFDAHNAGQCGSCFNGTASMAGVLKGLAAGQAGQGDIDRLTHWSVDLRKRGACGTLDGAVALAASVLREFPQAVDAHLAEACPTCASSTHPAAPFAWAI